ARSPSSSRLTMVSSSEIADSKSLIVGSMTILSAHVALELSFLQGDADAVARLHGRRTPDDYRPVRIPADRVAARKYAERAQVLERAGQRGETSLRLMTGAPGRRAQPASSVGQPRPDSCEVSSQIARFKPQPQHAKCPFASPDAGDRVAPELIGQLRGMASA